MSDGTLKNVLIIEDDVGYRNPLSTFLSSHGCTVFTADDGEQAMERILFYKPDLIILDLLLPKVDGFAVLSRIRTYPKPEVAAIPLVILTNLSSPEDMAKAQAFNIDAYFVKTDTSFEEVSDKIQEILFKGKPPKTSEILDFRNVQ